MFLEPVSIPQYLEPVEVARQYLIRYAPATRKAYEADLEKWFDFCASVDLEPFQATRPAVETFARLLSESRGLSAASVARCLAAVAGFYDVAFENFCINANPTTGVKRPKTGSDTAPTGLTAEELRKLIIHAKMDGPRSWALVMLLAFTGMRISEALNANIGDLGQERGTSTIKVTRKGGKTSVLPLTSETMDSLYYLMEDNPYDDVDSPLFQTRTGGRFHRADAHKLLRRLGNTHPHALRHAFITLSLEAGAPLHEVQDAAGHSDPRTTQRYNDARNRLDNHPSKLLGFLL